MSRTYGVGLADSELLILDGRCNGEAQQEVERAKARLDLAARYPDLSEGRVAFVVQVIEEARTSQLLTYQHTMLDRCGWCGKDEGYYKHKRSGRYHRAGDIDYSKRRRIAGVELARRFVTFQGHAAAGACKDCIAAAAPALRVELAEIPAELPEALMGEPPRWKRWQNRECAKCGWKGHEGQMRMLPAILGGSYPGGCPNCAAENNPFGARLVKTLDSYTVVPRTPQKHAHAVEASTSR